MSDESSGIYFEERWLSADDARLMLMDNPINRRIAPHVVAKMAVDMACGRWGDCPQPISLTRAGQLLDGQHRLSAIIDADAAMPGIKIRMYVACNVPESAINVIDIGKVRTVANTLSIHGYTQTDKVQAAARAVLRYERWPHLVWSTNNDPSRAELTEFCLAARDQIELLDARSATIARRTRVTAAGFLTLNWLTLRHSRHLDHWDDFTDGLIEGAALAIGDARLVLRNRNPGPSEGWGSGQGRLGIYVKAWNAYVEGREVRLLRFTRQELPMPPIR